MSSNHGGFTAEKMTSLLITYQGSSGVVKLNMSLWIVLFVVFVAEGCHPKDDKWNACDFLGRKGLEYEKCRFGHLKLKGTNQKTEI